MRNKYKILCAIFVTLMFSACSNLPTNPDIASTPAATTPIASTYTPMTSTSNNTSPETKPFSFKIFETGSSGGFSEANHHVELKLETTKQIDNSVEQQLEFSFGDAEHTLQYDCTEQGYLYNSYYDCYIKSAKNTAIMEVHINRHSKRIIHYTYYDFLYLQHLDENAEKPNPDERLLIVYDLLKQFVSDADMYQIYLESSIDTEEHGHIDIFYLHRYIGGVRTSDKATIWITEYGDIITYDLRGLGDMQGAQLPTEEEMAQIHTGTDAKKSEIYQTLEDRYDITYQIKDVLFIRLADGRYAFQYFYGVNLTPHGDGVGHSEVVSLIVILDT